MGTCSFTLLPRGGVYTPKSRAIHKRRRKQISRGATEKIFFSFSLKLPTPEKRKKPSLPRPDLLSYRQTNKHSTLSFLDFFFSLLAWSSPAFSLFSFFLFYSGVAEPLFVFFLRLLSPISLLTSSTLSL